jgi:hypothetical protein
MVALHFVDNHCLEPGADHEAWVSTGSPGRYLRRGEMLRKSFYGWVLVALALPASGWGEVVKGRIESISHMESP